MIASRMWMSGKLKGCSNRTLAKTIAPLIKAIEKYTHWKALKSAYFIDTSQSASTIRDSLMKLVDKNDVLFVMELKQHWGCSTTTTATDWLLSSSRSWASRSAAEGCLGRRFSWARR